MKLELKTKSGKSLKHIELEQSDDLIQKVAQAMKLNKNRIRLTQDGVQITKQSELKGNSVVFKDLGPQISWKMVFVIEYLGPILIHLFFYLKYQAFTPNASLSLLMITIHYLKREYETLRVHRFSNATMPLLNLPKNCFHYWVLGSCFSYFIYQKNFEYFFDLGSLKPLVFMLWVFAQLANYTTHCILRDLRPVGSTVRKIPFGYGFNLVSCPNYTFEILGWTMYTLLFPHPLVFFFTIVGAVQMYFWAVKKHYKYRKEFKEYPPHRKIIVPYFL